MPAGRTTDIVTLSQLVAFLAFQIRVVAGLRALAAAAPSHWPPQPDGTREHIERQP